MPVTEATSGVIRTISLDRLDKRNAINTEMTESIDAALNRFEDDPSLRVAVLTGDETVFCAGTDIAEGSGTPTERGGEYGIIRRRCTKPIIAAVEGAALGGGFEIALACHLIIAAEDARFGLPEVRRGLVATSGALFRAPRALPRNVANELLLTGDPIGAPRLEALGVVNRIVPSGTAVAAAMELAERIALNAPTSLHATLQALYQQTEATDQIGWAATEQAKGTVIGSADQLEGVTAFFERRDPDWPGR